MILTKSMQLVVKECSLYPDFRIVDSNSIALACCIALCIEFTDIFVCIDSYFDSLLAWI